MSSLKIPDDWSGEDALIVVSFLEEIIHAIWSRHRWEMGLVMERSYRDVHSDAEIDNSEEEAPDFGDDAIPF